jgi:hypothetical protein
MIKPIHIFVTFFFVMFLFGIALQSNRNTYLYNKVAELEEQINILQYNEQRLLHTLNF